MFAKILDVAPCLSVFRIIFLIISLVEDMAGFYELWNSAGSRRCCSRLPRKAAETTVSILQEALIAVPLTVPSSVPFELRDLPSVSHTTVSSVVVSSDQFAETVCGRRASKPDGVYTVTESRTDNRRADGCYPHAAFGHEAAVLL